MVGSFVLKVGGSRSLIRSDFALYIWTLRGPGISGHLQETKILNEGKRGLHSQSFLLKSRHTFFLYPLGWINPRYLQSSRLSPRLVLLVPLVPLCTRTHLHRLTSCLIPVLLPTVPGSPLDHGPWLPYSRRLVDPLSILVYPYTTRRVIDEGNGTSKSHEWVLPVPLKGCRNTTRLGTLNETGSPNNRVNYVVRAHTYTQRRTWTHEDGEGFLYILVDRMVTILLLSGCHVSVGWLRLRSDRLGSVGCLGPRWICGCRRTAPPNHKTYFRHL